MEIIGTKRETFDLVLSTFFCKKGDILSAGVGVDMEIVNKYKINKTLPNKYKVTLILVGEELEIAWNHYLFLKKYNLI